MAESQPIVNDDEPTKQVHRDSQTASEFIEQQLSLEADARDTLPYKFDRCTKDLGPLRQDVYACLTCSPPPASAAQQYTPAGICYSCSIACHGDHNLVELFSRRNFVCDCGSARFTNGMPCTLRSDPVTGARGVSGEEAAKENQYNHNFRNQFCACGEEYDADKEKGTMYQCAGLGTVENGGCGEDWYHPECLMGLPKDWSGKDERKDAAAAPDGEEKDHDHPKPEGFPDDDDFEGMICYKCVDAYPWLKAYAGTEGFLPPVFHKAASDPAPISSERPNLKRKASDDADEDASAIARAGSPVKRVKEENITTSTDKSSVAVTTSAAATLTPATDPTPVPSHKHTRLPAIPPTSQLTLFLREDFRDHLCHCPACYPNLIPHRVLREEESVYAPSLSSDSPSHPNGATNHSAGSTGTRSILERGESALNNIDRVRAIEGVMAYNHLKDKVKTFLQPFAESGKVVSAEDVKAYFEGLRGDSEGIREAREKPTEDENETGGDGRREQRGY
ncbi:Protein mlo2 [Cyphellophora attinorum]|uniref:Protein mlo2 n=1 Tax=Cyphellophora attinorum TaxID=1664694 RepID=A0A0N1P343_9EURO|nr:Protein mlo2 [Phialophora attinorum]KPI43454.1 Protein mlo2 [Phialophora attinorum]